MRKLLDWASAHPVISGSVAFPFLFWFFKEWLSEIFFGWFSEWIARQVPAAWASTVTTALSNYLLPFAVTALVIFGCIYIGRRSVGVISKPSNTAWAQRNYLELSAIANLSVGKAITEPYDNEPQLSRHRFLKDAVRTGALTTVDMAGKKPNVMTVIAREDFRTYANSSEHKELLSVLEKWDKLNPPKYVEAIKSLPDGSKAGSTTSLNRAYVELNMKGGVPTLVDSLNVTSITDAGLGNITITFGGLRSKNYSVIPIGSTPRDFKIVEQTKDSVSIQFKEEPQYAAFRFEE